MSGYSSSRNVRRQLQRAAKRVSSRRRFLMGAGGGALALPLLESWGGKPSHAGAGGAPKRLVIMSLGHSMDVEGGRDLANFEPTHDAGQLTGMSPMLSPLTSHTEKLSFITGIDNLVAQTLASNGHNGSGRTVLSYTPHQAAAFDADGRLSASQDNNPIGCGPRTDHAATSVWLTFATYRRESSLQKLSSR